jgi:glucose-6-phosphate 1-dehydrogenase
MSCLLTSLSCYLSDHVVADVVEKPFGSDSETFEELTAAMNAAIPNPSEIYRIDHYLGKNQVENLITLRFSNTIFERMAFFISLALPKCRLVTLAIREAVTNCLVYTACVVFFLNTATWNRHYVSSVMITMKESFGTQGRGGFFDTTGNIRDVCANHLIQFLSMVAMEAPTSNSGEAIRDAKRNVLDCIKRTSKFPRSPVERCLVF